MISIRPFTATDAAAYQALRLAALQDAPTAFASSYEEECNRPLDKVAARLGPQPGESCVFGAFVDGALVGMVGLKRDEHIKLAHKAFIWGVYVAPTMRGRGAGQKLMKAALDHAASWPGLRQVYLGVNAVNQPAIRLYERMGFATYGREPACMIVNGEAIDELLMVWILDDGRWTVGNGRE